MRGPSKLAQPLGFIADESTNRALASARKKRLRDHGGRRRPYCYGRLEHGPTFLLDSARFDELIGIPSFHL